LIVLNEDTRFARRAARESDGLNGLAPGADVFDTFSVVSMPRCARNQDFVIETY